MRMLHTHPSVFHDMMSEQLHLQACAVAGYGVK